MNRILFLSTVALGLMSCSRTQITNIYLNGAPVSHDNPAVEKVETTQIAEPCKDGFQFDDYTLYLDELEAEPVQGTLVEGVCGKALSLKSGESVPLSINMIQKMKRGTAEFWFKPGEGFFNDSSRTLLGNNESRLHFFVKNKRLFFEKNHERIHNFVDGPLELKDGWNHIAGQWGDGYMSIWVNDKLVAKKSNVSGYQPTGGETFAGSVWGNRLTIGYKAGCCMSATGQHDEMYTSGAFDQVRISTVPRYAIPPDESYPLFKMIQGDTVLFENFDRNFDYKVSLMEGVSGKAGMFGNGDKLVLPAVADSLFRGTFEFSFKPGKNFNSTPNMALVGSDEGRLTFVKEQGKIYFYKNLPYIFIRVGAEVSLDEGWNTIAAQWNGEYIALFVNGKLVAIEPSETSYSPHYGFVPVRISYENSIVVGYKSSCCMIAGKESYSDGAFDNILITKKLRYTVPVEAIPSAKSVNYDNTVYDYDIIVEEYEEDLE